MFSNTEKEIVARKRTQSPERSGITVAAAKYASEDGATLVNYTIAIVEYTRLCGPLKAALEKQNELIREIEENERVQKEKDEQVGNRGEEKLGTRPSQPSALDTPCNYERLSYTNKPWGWSCALVGVGWEVIFVYRIRKEFMEVSGCFDMVTRWVLKISGEPAWGSYPSSRLAIGGMSGHHAI